MRDQKLVKALRGHAEWAEGNQWETPITLCDDLAVAAEAVAMALEQFGKVRVVLVSDGREK